MKKTIIFCLIFVGVILPLHAQLYTPSGGIQGASNGNVGIGTATPESGYKIDVNGSATIGNASSTRVYMGTLNENTSYIQSRNTTINKNLSILADNVGVGTATPESGYKIDVNGSATIGNTSSTRVYMGTLNENTSYIQSRNSAINKNLSIFADNVGIGTTNPSTKLESVGNEVISFEAAGFYNTRVYGNVNDKSETRINLGKIEGDIRQPMGSIGAFPDNNTDSSRGCLAFYTRWSQSVVERLRINSNGYVGIGTTSISDILHLRSSNPVIRLEKEGVLNWRAGNVVGNNYTICPDSHNNTTFNITSAGNVGIGTTNPTSKLTVAGDINSREVKVTVNAGADFVFEKDYNLPSLASIDAYIKENKHLPEIASAKEMKTNGINLSEMNIKLLQKMEEMTLYMIEQNKELKMQNEKILTLEKKIEALTK